MYSNGITVGQACYEHLRGPNGLYQGPDHGSGNADSGKRTDCPTVGEERKTLPKGARGKSRSWVFTIFPKDLENYPWDPNTIAWDEVTPKLDWIVCGLEFTKQTNLHWQGVCRFQNQVTLATVKKALGDQRAHLETTRGTLQQAVAYCTKLDSGVCHEGTEEKIIFSWPDSWESLDLGEATHGRKTNDDFFREAIEMGTLESAWQHLLQHVPRDCMLYGPRIRESLRSVFEEQNLKCREPKTYSRPFYSGQLGTKSLLLSGRPNAGKTNFALDHFKYPLLVRHTEDLKRFNPRIDGLVFDDLSFAKWSPQNVIHLVDCAEDSTINVKYGSVTLPAGMPRIFTCNRSFDEWVPSECSADEKEAIRRRVIVLNVQANLY